MTIANTAPRATTAGPPVIPPEPPAAPLVDAGAPPAADDGSAATGVDGVVEPGTVGQLAER